MTIERIHGTAAGRCRASAYNGLVYAVATHESDATDIFEQTRNTLLLLDDILKKAGSSKRSIIQATVYLHDISMKADMDTVWCEWIGSKEFWPQRACVGAALPDDDLIEIVVTAVQE